MTISPSGAHQLPKPPPGVYANRIADLTHAAGERWCVTPGCQHMVDAEHRVCPCCEDQARRGR